MSRANPNTTHGNAGVAAWSFKMLAEVHSFEDCARVSGGDEVKIGPNMWLYPRLGAADGSCGYAVKLYETEIIRYYRDGSFSVSNGGHATPTTMYRLGAVLPTGFSAYHHRKQLGLRADSLGVTFAPLSRWARAEGMRVLWPLDHHKRIDCAT